MQFRTQINITKANHQIDYNSKIISFGSCFAVNIAEKLSFFKFQNTYNPFGILFQPLAIEKLIDFAVSQKLLYEKDLFFYNEQWHCFYAHSEWSNSKKEELLANLNEIIVSTYAQLTDASHVIITYGTSWVYRDIGSNEIVANCHKVPQKQFQKELLSVEVIQKSIKNSIRLIRSINSNVNFIFTVSPVRHIKDGFVENQVSKAHLISALHQNLKSENCKLKSAIYFPSYEIMMDELRDYRFYAEDMLHPNQVAIDYIWQRFSESTISEDSYSIMKDVVTIQKGLQHRAFNPESESHQQFLGKLQDKIALLQKQFPKIQF